uniref:ATP synthase complex subunit 8 n=1 Tax=Colochela zhongi TaxID=2675636 RepID=A0A7G5VU03_9HYME|nr:ATP synthase F0 subunit 8 [Colochela zhongi]
MPQMSPLNWIILMLFFITIFLIFNIINFFNIKINTKKIKFDKVVLKKNINSWKW